MQISQATKKILNKPLCLEVLFYINAHRINYITKIAKILEKGVSQISPIISFLIREKLIDELDVNKKEPPYSKLDPRNKYFEITNKGKMLVSQIAQLDFLLK